MKRFKQYLTIRRENAKTVFLALIKGIKDEDFCVFEGCPGVFVSDYLNEDIRKRVEKLEVNEMVKKYKDIEETRNICRKYADEIRGLGDKK